MKLAYTTSPHLRGKDTTARLMGDVVLALLPALIVGIAFQGVRALVVTLISVASAVAAEGLYRLVTRQYNTLTDCSAVVTGLLLAMTLPATVPYWLPAAGAVLPSWWSRACAAAWATISSIRPWRPERF